MAAANTALRRLSDADQRRLESRLDDFEASWTERALDSHARRLPADALRLPALVEMVKIDLEKQWGLGRRPRVEGYLHAYPELGTRDTVTPDLLQAEHEVRRQFGEPDPLDDLAHRFPRQADRLRALVQSAPPSGPVPPPRNRETVAAVRSTRSQALPEAAPQELPERFGRYLIVRRLGGGGMGTVYLAEDPQLKRQVALKVPHFAVTDGPEVRERFLREARAAAALSHPNLCPVHEVGEVDGTPYFTMQFVEGKSLAEVLARVSKEGRPLPPRWSAAVVARVAQAMAAAHRRGVVHRDLKPANIMVKKEAGEKDDVVVMDFGLARRKTDSKLTQAGCLMGTPAYMPPEVLSERLPDAGAAGDVYTLGVILYELLTGRPPFEAAGFVELGIKIATEEAPPPRSVRSELDERLEAICRKAMAKKPEERYASMEEFAAALTGYLKVPQQPGASKPGAKGAPIAAGEDRGSPFGDLADAPAAAPKIGKKGREEAEPAPSAWWKRSAVLMGAACAALSLVVLAGIVIKIKVGLADGDTGKVLASGGDTDKQKLPPAEAVVVLEIDQPGAEVSVDGQKITVTVPGDNKPVEIKVEPGQHKLRIGKDGFEAVTQDIELKTGKSASIRVRLEPLAGKPRDQPNDPASPADSIKKAKEVYEAALKNADQRLLAAFDRELEALSKAKMNPDARLKLIDTVKAEKAAFESKGRIPWSAPLRVATQEYLAALAANRQGLSRSFDEAIEFYLDKKDKDKANEYSSEKQRALEPKLLAVWNYTVWPGKTDRWEFFSDGTIGRGRLVWSFSGDTFVMRGPLEGSEDWIDTCKCSDDGRTMSGKNQWGYRKYATLVQVEE